jgi:hypothetical protein
LSLRGVMLSSFESVVVDSIHEGCFKLIDPETNIS